MAHTEDSVEVRNVSTRHTEHPYARTNEEVTICGKKKDLNMLGIHGHNTMP